MNEDMEKMLQELLNLLIGKAAVDTISMSLLPACS